MKCNDEFKPKCPSCKPKEANFGASQVQLGDGADRTITLLSCLECGHVIGAFSESAYQKPLETEGSVTAKSSCCDSDKFIAYFDTYASGFKDPQPALILCGKCKSTVIATLPSIDAF